MGRCSSLTDYEKGRIEGMRDCGTSLRKIASQLGRSHNVVNNYLKNKSGYGKKKKTTGSPRKVLAEERRHGKMFQWKRGKSFQTQCTNGVLK